MHDRSPESNLCVWVCVQCHDIVPRASTLPQCHCRGIVVNVVALRRLQASAGVMDYGLPGGTLGPEPVDSVHNIMGQEMLRVTPLIHHPNLELADLTPTRTAEERETPAAQTDALLPTVPPPEQDVGRDGVPVPVVRVVVVWEWAPDDSAEHGEGYLALRAGDTLVVADQSHAAWWSGDDLGQAKQSP